MTTPQDARGPGAGPQVYRLAPAVVVRLVGSFLVVLALVIFASTAVVALAGLPPDVLVVPLLLGVAGVFVLGWWLRRRAWVLRLDDEGYTVRLVRGSRVPSATWREVRQVVTASPRGVPCLILSLQDGRETVLPVQAVQGDREQLVRDVQARLRAARG